MAARLVASREGGDALVVLVGDWQRGGGVAVGGGGRERAAAGGDKGEEVGVARERGVRVVRQRGHCCAACCVLLRGVRLSLRVSGTGTELCCRVSVSVLTGEKVLLG